MTGPRVFTAIHAVFALLAALTPTSVWSASPPDRWWGPGEPRTWPSELNYSNDRGQLGVLNASGRLETKGHPFFEPLGTNGRACVTCHQPADGMSLAAWTARQRWELTQGKDPLFAAIDGSNCPHLPQQDPASHSLLLGRGLIRVALPWPPRGDDGKPIDPEFTLEVVRDPTGCNTHPTYGLTSADPRVSVYRRPRPMANTKYTTHENFGVLPFIGKNGLPASRDPDTGRPSAMNLMADARFPTLRVQAQDAAANHLQVAAPLSRAQLDQIFEFQSRVYMAQAHDAEAGSLTEPGGPSGLGPQALEKGEAGVLGNNTTRWVIPMEEKWKKLPPGRDIAETRRNQARESIQRG